MFDAFAVTQTVALVVKAFVAYVDRSHFTSTFVRCWQSTFENFVSAPSAESGQSAV